MALQITCILNLSIMWTWVVSLHSMERKLGGLQSKSTTTTLLISLMNMSDVDGLPVPSSSLTLTQPCGKSWHYFHTCWEDISTTHGLNLSVDIHGFCVLCPNNETARTPSPVHSFSVSTASPALVQMPEA
jgi:hypothetical protein